MQTLKIDKETAQRLVPVLLAACDELNKAANMVIADLPTTLAAEFNTKIANAMTVVGWDILECMVYSSYSELRPYSIDDQYTSERE